MRKNVLLWGGKIAVDVLFGVTALALGRSSWLERGRDWNLYVRSERELQGVWIASGTELRLDPEGQYFCRGDACGRIGTEGHWERVGDFYVSFVHSPGAKSVEWRTTKRREMLEILSGRFPDDPDLWRVDSVYAKR